jgi:hypothetical protein
MGTMKKRLLLALVLSIGASTLALAGGTADQEAACRGDTRRFCHQIPAGGGDSAFLACLQANRAKLSPKCRQVLESNGV